MDGIELYQTSDGFELQVKTDQDTVWLRQSQMEELFGRDQSVISRHIKNAIAEKEIDEESNMQNLHIANSDRPVTFYNLDVVISVGYRVKSPEGVQFRKWATGVLRTHLIKGYTRNQKRLDYINQVVGILERSADEAISGVASILQNYTEGLDILDSYDHQTLAKPKGESAAAELTYAKARDLVDSMRFSRESNLFGVERDDLFKAIVAQIYQSFDGREFYPTTQDKAAALLYFCVKDHPFLDGNKRIAAALFVYFLELNGALRDKDGALVIANNTLAAITLMIALSHPEEKEAMCLLVLNFLKRDND